MSVYIISSVERILDPKKEQGHFHFRPYPWMMLLLFCGSGSAPASWGGSKNFPYVKDIQ